MENVISLGLIYHCINWNQTSTIVWLYHFLYFSNLLVFRKDTFETAHCFIIDISPVLPYWHLLIFISWNIQLSLLTKYTEHKRNIEKKYVSKTCKKERKKSTWHHNPTPLTLSWNIYILVHGGFSKYYINLSWLLTRWM